MLTEFLPGIGTLVVAEAGQGTTGLIIVVGVVGVLLAAFAWQRSRSLQQQLTQKRAAVEQAQEATKAAQAHEREVAKKAEERQEELRQLKQEVAGLRKKNHTVQEETKALREQLRAQAEERQRLLTSRPAFETAPSKGKAIKPVKQAETPVASVAATPVVAPMAAVPNVEVAAGASSAPVAAAPVAMSVVAAPVVRSDDALLARLAKLEAERTALAAALEAARESDKAQKLELAQVRHYAEQLRRIDIISKGKVEILEDKVAAFGRQYYEAVSELAAVKGEVAVPARRSGDAKRSGARPKQRRPNEGAAGVKATEHSEEGHATPEADALAMQMDAADAAVGADQGAAVGEEQANE